MHSLGADLLSVMLGIETPTRPNRCYQAAERLQVVSQKSLPASSQWTFVKGLLVSIGWYLGYLRAQGTYSPLNKCTYINQM